MFSDIIHCKYTELQVGLLWDREIILKQLSVILHYLQCQVKESS